MYVALVRSISPSLPACQITHKQREAIDVRLAREQHQRYVEALVDLQCSVQYLPALPDLPDAVFAEDVAVVFPEVAVLTRPGAPLRRAEVESVATTLAEYRDLRAIEGPGTMDGGDVLQLGREVFVGLSDRTNKAGVDQLTAILEPFGYTVKAIPIHLCLHLKTAVTEIADNTLLLNPDWIDRTNFRNFDIVEVHPSEPFGANALRIGDSILCPSDNPRTLRRLAEKNLAIRVVDISELRKAEAGITCCSLIFQP